MNYAIESSEIINYSLTAAVGFLVSMLCTGRLIPYLRHKQFGQFIREEGPEAHLAKAGTPTMGGLAMAAGITAAVILAIILGLGNAGDLIAVLLSMYAFGAVGFIDDYNKIAKKQNEGLTPRQKLLLQCLFGVLLALFMMYREGTSVFIPFIKTRVDIGWFYIPFVVFIELAMTNSVNLTDGLDGLASSQAAIVACTFAVLGILQGSPSAMGASGQAVFGAAVGFLMYNRYPAQIFMGDTGSMGLGGVLSAMAIVGGMEWLLPIAGAIFVIEALSVIIQVGYFKLSGGKRVFRMAPIHHHFELGGLHETKVVKRFCIFTFVCCIIAVISVI